MGFLCPVCEKWKTDRHVVQLPVHEKRIPDTTIRVKVTHEEANLVVIDGLVPVKTAIGSLRNWLLGLAMPPPTVRFS